MGLEVEILENQKVKGESILGRMLEPGTETSTAYSLELMFGRYADDDESYPPEGLPVIEQWSTRRLGRVLIRAIKPSHDIATVVTVDLGNGLQVTRASLWLTARIFQQVGQLLVERQELERTTEAKD
jgi:hypothetical protein